MDRSVFDGARASNVALSCTATLALSLLAGCWLPDNSGAVAAVGLLGVYTGSAEVTALFAGLAPFSAFLTLLRLGGAHGTHGRGWLIIVQLLEIAAQVAGGMFAWSLHRSAAAGEGAPLGYGGGGYGLGGGGGGGVGGVGGRPSFSPHMAPPPVPQPPVAAAAPAPAPPAYARVDDPFSSVVGAAAARGPAVATPPASQASPAPAAAAAAAAPPPSDLL